jgi:protein-tyrosine phosphatase
MAEALLRDSLQSRGVDARVSSAGISFDGRGATEDAIRAAEAFDLDITGHRSRIMNAEVVQQADLVIGMERLHAREAVVLGPTLFGRTFTLKEIVRRGELIGPRRADESLDEWMARAGEGRRPMELFGESPDDDIPDPYQQSPKVYAKCIELLDDLTDRLVDLVWPVAHVREEAG